MVGVLLAVLVIAGLNLVVTLGIHQLVRPESTAHRRRRRLAIDLLVRREAATLDQEYEDLLSRSR